MQMARKWEGRMPGQAAEPADWKHRARRAEAEREATRAIAYSQRLAWTPASKSSNGTVEADHEHTLVAPDRAAAARQPVAAGKGRARFELGDARGVARGRAELGETTKYC